MWLHFVGNICYFCCLTFPLSSGHTALVFCWGAVPFILSTFWFQEPPGDHSLAVRASDLAGSSDTFVIVEISNILRSGNRNGFV